MAESTCPRVQVSTLDDWRRLISTSFVPLEVEATDRSRFTATMRAHNANGVGWYWMAAGAHAVRRVVAADDDDGMYKVSVILNGSGLLIQDDREAVLRSGDLAIYDASLPYTLAFDHDFESLVLKIPRSVLDLPIESVRRVTAVAIQADSTLGRVVSPSLLAVGHNFDSLTRPSSARVANALVDLVAAVCADALAERADREGFAPGRLGVIQDYIDAHLGDESLTPTSIAQAHYVSTRHLHNVFAEAGVGVAEWTRTRRLERCRRDLADPFLTDRSIREIGARWGLGDAAHLSRLFKAKYGVSPREYRGDALGGSAAHAAH